MRLAASAVYEYECGPKIKRDSKPVSLGGNCRRARPTRNALLRRRPMVVALRIGFSLLGDAFFIHDSESSGFRIAPHVAP